MLPSHNPSSSTAHFAECAAVYSLIVQEVYEAGHRHFGENYVQELREMAPLMPNDTEVGLNIFFA